MLMLLLMSNKSIAQPESAVPFQVSFLKDSMTMEDGAFQFNNIRIENRTHSVQQVHINLDNTGLLNLTSPKQQQITLQAGELRTIPFRFTARNQQQLSWQQVGVSISVMGGSYTTVKSFIIRNPPSSKWKASLVQPTMIIPANAEHSQFSFFINNLGNTKIAFSTRIEASMQGIVPEEIHPVQLEAGASQLIHIPINTKEFQLTRSRSVEVLLYIRSSNGEEKMLRQLITPIGSVYRGDVSAWHSMPLSVEATMMNMGTGRPFVILGAQGSLQLGLHDQLNIQLRSNNFYDGYATNTYQASVQYKHRDLSLTAGTILDYNQFLFDGNGLRLQVDKENARWQLSAIQSRNGEQSLFDAKQHIKLNKRLSWKGNTVVQLDRDQLQENYLHLSTLQFDISSLTSLQLHAGYGAENYRRQKMDTLVGGWQGGISFNTSLKRWSLNSSISLFPKNFPGINKGSQYQLHELKYTYNKFITGPYIETNSRRINQFNDSLLNELLTIDNKEYGWRLGFQSKNFSLVLSPGLLRQNQDSASNQRVDLYKLSLNSSWQLNEKWSLSFYSNAGKMFTGKTSPLFIHNHFMSIQSRYVGIHARWDEGPFFYYEVKNYLQSNKKTRRIQVSPYADLMIRKWHLNYRAQVNYALDNSNATQQLFQAYHSLQYDAVKAGINIAINAQHDFNGTMTPLFNLSIRKRLELPVIPNKRSKKAVIVLFLDANNNKVHDKDEQTISNARVNVQGNWVETNGKGQLILEQLGDDKVQVDLSNIQQLRGWLPSGGYKQQVIIGKGAAYTIPFSKSRIISGRIHMVMDENSELFVPVDGIRITATSRDSEIFQTLTGQDGQYYLNLPSGDYLLNMNTGAFDQQFKAVEPIKQVDLKHNEQLQVDFEVRQKKRQMNIRKE